ncbi:LysR family transcriptional regulator [Ligilactobacillus aviarius]|uniref:LysR family transcriptional regulator n=1 Tax=Ligilactobacillus aviarius TaxID=1606 RepID=UPI00195A8785|nr:LysR family transcriptional regulator [Ligilactobacillus aviarius]MBM6863166.1 LysR family transcriptional regulator [Ligilactobacillus aviarius]
MFDSLNIDLLYVFVTVSELKSINKSSEVLLLSQPAISNKIKKLEEYFGKKLLERSPKGVLLTKDGEAFYHKAKTIIREFDALHHLDSSDNEKKGFSSIQIGSLDSISSFLYPEFFAAAIEEANSVTITNKISELINPFNVGDLDVILADSELKKGITADCSEYKLYSEPYYIVFSKDNELNTASDEKVTAEKLQQFKLILYPKYCPIHNKVSRVYKNLEMTMPKVYEIDYGESIISIVKNSDYVTLLPESIALNKVSANNEELCLKEMEVSFMRNISVFSNNKIPMDMILKKLNVKE